MLSRGKPLMTGRASGGGWRIAAFTGLGVTIQVMHSPAGGRLQLRVGGAHRREAAGHASRYHENINTFGRSHTQGAETRETAEEE